MDVVLRDVREGDLPVFFEHQVDPASIRMAAFAPRDESAFMAHWQCKILADRTVAKKTILADGQVVGYVLCFEQSGKREIGYWVGRDHWGKGIATRALSLLLRQVTERPLYAVVAKHNTGSVRVLEKCGFVIVGQEHRPGDARGPAVEELTLRLNASEERGIP